MKKRILNELIHLRTGRALDDVISKDKGYQDAMKQQNTAFEKLERTKRDKKQHRIIDRAISANNNCGAVYGAVAYRLGLKDGIRLMKELESIG